ncbi:M23 family metallopeptidase [Aquimarina pacifica]|uniref:M23 family metallopeptidase n=1 Tax=Aquimarina pacifica TaxID=1296415 RepID=UPI0004B02AAC|nr:M23 family metallopeptidase [Aquimarina pacifica]
MSAQEVLDQKVKVIGYKKIVVQGNILDLPIYPDNNNFFTDKNDDIHHIIPEDSEDFLASWDTKRFNPYSKGSVDFPIKLVFSDKEYSSPVSRKMVVTSRFGWRRGRPHQGIDIDLQIGDSVKTLLDGKVRFARYYSSYGNVVVVRHHNGLETVYAHLSKLLVKENDVVSKGDILGKGGVTGNARGSHLHLEVRYRGKSINPEYLFEFDSDTKIRSEALFVTRKWASPRSHKSTRQSKIVVHKTIDHINVSEELKKKTYVVRKGDTLHRIANEHGLAVSEICKNNSINYNSVLKIGQEIIIN